MFLSTSKSEQLEKFFDGETALFDDRVKQWAGEIAALVHGHGGRSCGVGVVYQPVMTAGCADNFKTATLQGADHVC